MNSEGVGRGVIHEGVGGEPPGDEPEIDAAAFAVRLCRACRARGLRVHPSAAIDIVACTGMFRPLGPGDLYICARAVCVHRPEDLTVFDEAFEASLAEVDASSGGGAEAPMPLPSGLPGDMSGSSEGAGDRARPLAYSRSEQIGARDIAGLSDDELAEIAAVFDRLVPMRSLRRRQRTQSSQRQADVLDLGRALKRARGFDGEIIDLPYRRRRRDPGRIVFLLDVSGSMQAYLPIVLRIVYLLSRTGAAIEVFSLGTRLTRVSRALDKPSPDAFVLEFGARVIDLAGGTRLGEAVRSFNGEFGVRGLARRATVIVVSDGLDRGDPALLGGEMERLGRVARRVIWVNPLMGTPGYAPLAGGMRAALRSIDRFVAGHSIDALVELVALVLDDPAPSRIEGARR